MMTKELIKGPVKLRMEVQKMFAKEPIDLDKIDEEISDRNILRFALAAELDAINFYEQMAQYTEVQVHLEPGDRD